MSKLNITDYKKQDSITFSSNKGIPHNGSNRLGYCVTVGGNFDIWIADKNFESALEGGVKKPEPKKPVEKPVKKDKQKTEKKPDKFE